MTGVTIEVVFDDADLAGALDAAAAALADTTPLMLQIGDYGRNSTRGRWQTQTGPDGTPWAPLNPAYAAMKPAGFGILYLHGALEGSITYQAGAAEVRWGSPIVYAAVHQFGAVIRPKSAKALVFKLGIGGVRDVRVQSVTIPARPYLGISAEDRVAITLLARDYIAGLFTLG